MREGNRFTMEWKLHSEYGQEKIVLDNLAHILSCQSIDPERIAEISTAVSEACLNALEHGNKLEQDQHVQVQMELIDLTCTFRIYDEGEGFHDLTTIKDPVAKYVERNPRGWGLMFMNSFADHIRVGSEENKFYVELVFHTNKIV